MDNTTESETIISDEQTTDYNNELSPSNDNLLNSLPSINVPSFFIPNINLVTENELQNNSTFIYQPIPHPAISPLINPVTYQTDLNNTSMPYNDWHIPSSGWSNDVTYQPSGWSNDIITDSDETFQSAPCQELIPEPVSEPTCDNYWPIPEQEPEVSSNSSTESMPPLVDESSFTNSQNVSINIPQVSESQPQANNQYSMLYNNDPDNPFSKCKFEPLEYDTDDEIDEKQIRVLFTWNYEFNYDYFSLNEIEIYITKNNIFKDKLTNIKNIRNNNNSNITGKIIKLNNIHFKKEDIIDVYLIAYYDNAKVNIEYYGMFNQPINEDKLIENIKLEGTYGKNGIFSTNFISSIGDNDFIVLYKRCIII